jgi:excisionase family DNA binding protein
MSASISRERKVKRSLTIFENRIVCENGSEPTMLTVSETAALLNLSVATVRRWCAEGLLPCHRFAKMWTISVRDLERWLIKQRWSSV